MRGNIWLHKGGGKVAITEVSAAEGKLHRVFNRGPGTIVLFDRSLAAGNTFDIQTSRLTAELAPDNPYDVGLVEWEYLTS